MGLVTSTTVVDIIRENGYIRGVTMEKGWKIKARLVIDAWGTQDNLSIKAGIRERYAAESIELYMI